MYKKGDLHIGAVYTHPAIMSTDREAIYLCSSHSHYLELYRIGDKEHAKQLVRDLKQLLKNYYGETNA